MPVVIGILALLFFVWLFSNPGGFKVNLRRAVLWIGFVALVVICGELAREINQNAGDRVWIGPLLAFPWVVLIATWRASRKKD